MDVGEGIKGEGGGGPSEDARRALENNGPTDLLTTHPREKEMGREIQGGGGGGINEEERIRASYNLYAP